MEKEKTRHEQRKGHIISLDTCREVIVILEECVHSIPIFIEEIDRGRFMRANDLEKLAFILEASARILRKQVKILRNDI